MPLHESCGNLILKESLYQMFWASDQDCGHYFFNRQINIIWISINGILFLWIPQYEFLKMSHPCIAMRPTVIAQTVIAQIIADVNSKEICQKARIKKYILNRIIDNVMTLSKHFGC